MYISLTGVKFCHFKFQRWKRERERSVSDQDKGKKKQRKMEGVFFFFFFPTRFYMYPINWDSVQWIKSQVLPSHRLISSRLHPQQLRISTTAESSFITTFFQRMTCQFSIIESTSKLS